MKKVIWSLFDSETAITQELNSDKYIVYSIGLPSSSAVTNNFIKMDLSKRSCLNKLEKLPKPDIIFASPPCETWVNMNICIVRYYKKIITNIIYIGKKILNQIILLNIIDKVDC